MVYFVKLNNTLSSIADKFGTSIQSILDANIICNPDLITEGEPLLIHDNKSHLDIPKAGAGPYYIIQPGDTLDCLVNQIGISSSKD